MIQSKKQEVAQRFHIKKQISEGAFGTVYLALDKENGQEVALKQEKNDNKNANSFRRETSILSHLERVVGVPEMYWYNDDSIAMQLLGSDLGILIKPYKRFSLKSVLMLAYQLFHTLQRIHQRGIVHRDLKPENILMGRDADQGIVYITDFGVSKSFRDSNNQHIKMQVKRPFVGTTRYASIAAHLGKEVGRKDDLESMMYGNLPWQNLGLPVIQRQNAIGELKQKIQIENLCSDLPLEFQHIFYYIKKLKFQSDPDYLKIIIWIKNAADSNGILFDYIYDWTDLKEWTRLKSLRSTDTFQASYNEKKGSKLTMIWTVNDNQTQNKRLLSPAFVPQRTTNHQDKAIESQKQISQSLRFNVYAKPSLNNEKSIVDNQSSYNQGVTSSQNKINGIQQMISLNPEKPQDNQTQIQGASSQQGQHSQQGTFSTMKMKYIPSVFSVNNLKAKTLSMALPNHTFSIDMDAVSYQRSMRSYQNLQDIDMQDSDEKSSDSYESDFNFNYHYEMDENCRSQLLSERYWHLRVTQVRSCIPRLKGRTSIKPKSRHYTAKRKINNFR